TGELAGWLTSGRWPPVPPDRAGVLLVGVILHPLHPALAWPRSAPLQPAGSGPSAAALSETTLLYGLGATVVAGVAALVLLVRGAGRSVLSGRRGSRRHEPWLLARRGRPSRAAAWARASDIAPLAVRRPVPGRLTLGVAGRHLLSAEPRQSVIVVGPTQTYKTSGFAVPAVLEWEGPVLASSVKADLVRDTMGWRRRVGEVWQYDPAAGTGLERSGWSPLAGARSWVGAKRVAAGLCATARASGGGLSDGDFWYSAAAKLLAPLLYAAASSGRTMSDVVRWVDEQEVPIVEAVLEELDVAEALQAARATWRRDDRQRSSVYTTAETVIEAFADPVVAASAARNDIDPARFCREGAHTLYLCAPARHQQRFQPLFSGLVTEVIDAAVELAAARGAPLDPPLLVVLDEAANVAPLGDLDVLAATAAGHGVQLVTVWQDLAQISARYGQRAATVVNNHRAKVVLSGISDPATLEHMSALIGEEEVAQSSTTRDQEGRRSTTTVTTSRRLAPADSLRRIRPGHGVLVYGYLPPVELRLRPWREDRTLAGRGAWP
ncbi:MAG: type IV secretory system conjugative DNA transfer family protein, partial [Acidimicrobiales bacterium]|nr:type IV secretory system conjugative DNA transfer family protein [Acidimicrobiales bacterium]